MLRRAALLALWWSGAAGLAGRGKVPAAQISVKIAEEAEAEEAEEKRLWRGVPAGLHLRGGSSTRPERAAADALYGVARFANLAPPGLGVRGGGGDAEASLFGEGTGVEGTVEEKLREGMKTTVAMMRGMGSGGDEVDALEAAAAEDAASVADLLSLYLRARLAQSKELAGGDHYADAVKLVANEAVAYKAAARLPEAAYADFMEKCAIEAGFDDAAAFEADVAESSALAVKELLAVLDANGNFVARALAQVDAKLPAIESDVAEDLANGDEVAVAAGRRVLDKYRAWSEDASPLESLRVELLNQLETAEDPVAKARVAASLKPVVTNLLGPDYSA